MIRSAPTKGDMGCVCKKREEGRQKVTTKRYVNAGNKGFLQFKKNNLG
jgi:hypothetical protein